MTLKPVQMFTVICDFPGCEADAFGDDAYAEYSCSDASGAIGQAVSQDWVTDADDQRHYCDNHNTIWESDLQDGEAEPERPYLLFLDVTADEGARLVLPELEDPRQLHLPLGGA